jgi:glycosyltransferase involved in cell wall biosynthesis/polysaccharide pyruvyl transferase WcaK-like protein
MPRLLLAGAPTGCWTNLGDEAILAGMAGALRAAIDDVHLTVVTSSPPETYAPYATESVRFDDLPALAAAVAGADAVLLGGGSIFFDYWGADAASVLTPKHQGVSLWTGLALLAAADGIPVMTYDVGIGPLRTDDGALMTRAAFQLARTITVRDSASAALATGWGLPAQAVTVTGDPAIRAELPNSGAGRDSDGPVLGVALRQWDSGIDDEAWYAALASALDSDLERTGGRVVFVASHRTVRWPLTDDAAAAAEVRARMSHPERAGEIPAEAPWAERAAALGACDAVLAMRYHAALFALRAGVPAVGLSYDAKVAGLFSDWGLPGRCLELAEAAAEPRRVADLLADPDAGAARGEARAAMWVGGSEMLRREHAAAGAVAELCTGALSAPAESGTARAPAESGTDAVGDLLARMAGTAGERPAGVNAALERLAGRIGAAPARRATVAILTNRLLDRASGEVRIGGAERYALALAQLLADLGLDPVFYQGGGSFEVGDFYGFAVHPIPFGAEFSEFQEGVAAEFHRRAAEAHHVLYLMPNYASGPIRDDAVVVSHGVWWDHEQWPHLALRTPEWAEHLARVFTRPRRVISVDANTGNVLRALFPAADEHIRHIPSAVDTDAFAPPARRGEGEPLVLFPRRAETIRGSHLLGPIMELVPDPARFVWLGGGSREQTAALRSLAARDARLTCTEAGFDEMPKHYAAADVCVIPSVGSEGQSLSCLEAMASGAAVVVTRVGGLPELVTDGLDGLVCEASPESLAAAIRRLVRDPGLRARLGAAARSTALRHSLQRWRADWARELTELGWVGPAAMSKAVPYDVVNFSIINFEQRYQRPQQLAAAWGRAGRRVFYVRVGDHLPPDGPGCAVARLAEGVYEVRLALPPGLKLHQGVVPEDLVPAAVAALGALRSQWHIDRAVAVVELGTWGPVAAAAREEFGWPVLYDCMDDWSTFPGFAERPAVLAAERELARSADVMTVSSRALQRRWASERQGAVLVRNAADFAFFHDAASRSDASCPEPMAGITRPVAGFFGAVVEWFDTELVRRVASARPEVSFVFVGNVARVSVEPLEALGNVHLLGPQPYEDMPRYLRTFDVCLVPFVADDVTASMDLVKVYEYFAQGKPVVTTPVAEMLRYGRELYLADGPEEFVAALDGALAEDDPEAVARRVALARSNSWEERIESLEREILPALAGEITPVAEPEPAAPQDLAAARAEAKAARARLERLNSSRAVRAARRYWALRRRVEKVVRRAGAVRRRARAG